jgi:hypothetical protein
MFLQQFCFFCSDGETGNRTAAKLNILSPDLSGFVRICVNATIKAIKQERPPLESDDRDGSHPGSLALHDRVAPLALNAPLRT